MSFYSYITCTMSIWSSYVWMLIIAWLIWLLTALGRGWNKWIEIHRLYATLITGIIMVVVSIGLIVLYKPTLDMTLLKENLLYILVPAMSIVIVRPLVIIGFQYGYSVSQFSLLFSMFSLIFTIGLWVAFYKESLTASQLVWILLSIGVIYLLK